MRVVSALFAGLVCASFADAMTLEAARAYASGQAPVRVLLADGVEQVEARATTGALTVSVGGGIGRAAQSVTVRPVSPAPRLESFRIEVGGLAGDAADKRAQAVRDSLSDVRVLSVAVEGAHLVLVGEGGPDAAEAALSQVGFLLPKEATVWLADTDSTGPAVQVALDGTSSATGAGVEIGSLEGAPITVGVRKPAEERFAPLGTYPGAIVIAPGARPGALLVVDAAPLEDYVAGVVESEMPSDAPPQALMAQAVAARSFALSRIDGDASLAYDIEANTRAQTYRGLRTTRGPASEAASGTAGIVLACQGDIVAGYYHSACGGATDAPVHVFGGSSPGLSASLADGVAAYGDLSVEANVRRLLRERPKAGCSSSSLYRWERKCSGEQLNAAVRASGLAGKVGKVRGLEVTSRSPGGRVVGLRLTGTSGSVVLSLQRVRSVLGRIPGGLPSTLFVIDAGRGAGGAVNSVRLIGGGFGHGAGMCQHCAMAMARGGEGYGTILHRYYAGSQLVALGGTPCP